MAFGNLNQTNGNMYFHGCAAGSEGPWAAFCNMSIIRLDDPNQSIVNAKGSLVPEGVLLPISGGNTAMSSKPKCRVSTDRS